MNKWQYLPHDVWFLKWTASANFAFGEHRTSLEDFGLLPKTSDFFGNLRKWSCRLQKSQHSQDKNLTLISQKKMAGIFSTLLQTYCKLYNYAVLIVYRSGYSDTQWLLFKRHLLLWIRRYVVTKWIRGYVVIEYLHIHLSTYPPIFRGCIKVAGYSAVKPVTGVCNLNIRVCCTGMFNFQGCHLSAGVTTFLHQHRSTTDRCLSNISIRGCPPSDRAVHYNLRIVAAKWSLWQREEDETN